MLRKEYSYQRTSQKTNGNSRGAAEIHRLGEKLILAVYDTYMSSVKDGHEENNWMSLFEV